MSQTTTICAATALASRFEPFHARSVTLVAIQCDTVHVRAKTFELPAGRNSLRAWIRKQQHDGYNIYYQLNLGARPSAKLAKHDITHIRGVGADVDAKDGRSLEDCRRAVDALPLPPTFTVETGGGFQPVWWLAIPLGANSDNVERAELLGTAIAHSIGGDAVQNVDRIFRVPGTINFPNARKRALGRTTAVAKFIDGNGRKYGIEEIEAPFTSGMGISLRAPPKHISLAMNADLTCRIEGSWFDLLSPQQKIDCVSEMLVSIRHLAAGSYDLWYRIIASIARAIGEPGRELAREWSMSCPEKYNAADFDRTFNSFLRGRNDG